MCQNDKRFAITAVFLAFFKCMMVECALPHELLNHRVRKRNDVIEDYFTRGYSGTEILSLLRTFYGIGLSLRHLKKILKS